MLPVYSKGMVNALRSRHTDKFPHAFYDISLEQGSRLPNAEQQPDRIPQLTEEKQMKFVDVSETAALGFGFVSTLSLPLSIQKIASSSSGIAAPWLPESCFGFGLLDKALLENIPSSKLTHMS